MTDFTWPSTIVPTTSSWRLEANTAAFVSPLNGATRTLARGGDRWVVSLQINNLTDANRSVLQAFLAQLRGQAHRVILPDHAYVKRGALTVNPLVKGANQTGTALATDGATAGLTSALRAGDWITVGGYLYMVTNDANSDGSGNLNLTIVPPLRSSPSDNATVTVTAPTARFLLASNSVGWSNTVAGARRISSSFSVDLIEDITA